MRHINIITLILLVFGASASCFAGNDRQLARQASKEYLLQIRPGNEGRNPYWNGFSPKFLFAPSFDFKAVDGADKYIYRLEQVDGEDAAFTVKIEPNAGRSIVGYESEGKKWLFTAATPNESLAKVWNDVPPSYIHLVVEGLDKDGKVLGLAGERTFLRDFPFNPPYSGKARPYRDAAIKAALYIHRMPEIQAWRKDSLPDMSYRHNTYPCKIIGATVRVETYVARNVPAVKDEAIEIARSAAAFLMSQSRPEGDPLAFFPPTYYGGMKSSGASWNKGKTMMMEAVSASNALLDLYEATGDEQYRTHVLGILDTYARQQAADGSFPAKVDFATGEPVNDAKAMLTTLMNLIHRVRDSYGIGKYDSMLALCEQWMKANPLETFDFTAQFEDVNILGMKPYEDLNNSVPAPYAEYLFRYGDKRDREDAVQIVRFLEDQFVHWDCFYDKYGIKTMCPPCACEQYKYNTPVDASAAAIAKAMVARYQATGDKLSLAKARVLADNVTITQNCLTGLIPTLWDEIREPLRRHLWVNCAMASIELLELMESLE